jgi:predicted DNA-binding transcriptional regulator AlpA
MPYPRKVRRPAPEGYISTADAMAFLDMSLRTFYKYKRESPDFPQQLMEGGKAWYKRADLETWKGKHMEP